MQISCSTVPKNFKSYSQGRWQAKTLVQDLSKNKSYVVYIDINAIRPDRARFDVETSLGMHIASLAYRVDTVQILLPEQRLFYQGPASPKSFSKLVPLELDPRWFMALLFDEDLEAMGWLCEKSTSDLATACERQNLKISWLKREAGVRVIALESPKAKLQMQLKNFRETAKPEEFYQLNKPEVFKLQTL